ncbi:hypothetical protein ACLOJK_019967 [Asimina triloba]
MKKQSTNLIGGSNIRSPQSNSSGNGKGNTLRSEGETVGSSSLQPDLKKTLPNFSILVGSDQQQPGGAVGEGDSRNPSSPVDPSTAVTFPNLHIVLSSRSKASDDLREEQQRGSSTPEMKTKTSLFSPMVQAGASPLITMLRRCCRSEQIRFQTASDEWVCQQTREEEGAP